MSCKRLCQALMIGLAFTSVPVEELRAQSAPKPDFPKYEEVIKGYEKVVSTADGAPSMYSLWVRKKDGHTLAELPRNYASKKYFIALTVASGERFAGLQAGDMYVYWRRYDKRLAMIAPRMNTRASGDQESKDSVQRLYTDTVVCDIPIVTMKPRGGPVIDLDDLVLSQGSKFFGGGGPSSSNKRLAALKVAKAFPKNIEIAYEVPTSGGVLKTFHYSFSEVPENTGYKPRIADQRVGYFTTSYLDLGKYDADETRVRYINRWHLEKADPRLKLSPPKNPIIYYVEHTTPIRYRRFVRDGVLVWNKAFEKIGIVDAIEVYYQDKATGAHMEKDPEDVRYNFVRWLNNNIGTAIGPSRVHPMTGQILDADVVLTDGWIRSFEQQFTKLLPEIAMQGMTPDTYAWLEKHPEWDPRLLLAPPHERATMMAQRMQRGVLPFGGHPIANYDSRILGDEEFDGLTGRLSQVNGSCLCAMGKGFDLAVLQMTREMLQDAEKDKDEKKEGEEEEELLDGMPADFIGPLLADLVAHEIGHTIGLRHNFKASALYSLDQVNSEEMKGKKAFTSSVMDYNPLNINMKDGKLQGDYAMIDIGPYDFWAIEYGYTFDNDLEPILKKCVEPENQYGTDEDTIGPDPFARRYDFTSDPIDYAKSQLELARYHRGRILEHFVSDGDSWAKAREGYERTLRMQTSAVSMMANWLGGAFVNRSKKGDGDKRPPVEVVPASKQREALSFVLETAFRDASYGLTAEMVRYMTVSPWSDGGFSSDEPTYPVHDRIMGLQGTVLTQLMNPSTLRRIYDNEFRISAEEDAITLPEVLQAISKEIWGELHNTPQGTFSTRKPMISSLRRNLQREHVERLIDLCMPGGGSGATFKAISALATMELSKLSELCTAPSGCDPYSEAHLVDTGVRIRKALDAQHIFNANDIGGGGSQMMFFPFKTAESEDQR